MLSYYEPKFIEKFLWESGVLNFGKIRNDAYKNWLFCRHFEIVKHFVLFFYFIYLFIFLQNYVV